jgi:hypothetical protein
MPPEFPRVCAFVGGMLSLPGLGGGLPSPDDTSWWTPGQRPGMLLYNSEINIWSEEVSKRMLALMRGIPQADLDALCERPGELFEPDEQDTCAAFTVLTILGGWDARLLPDHARWWVSFSHDAFAYIVCNTDEVASQVKTVLDWVSKLRYTAERNCPGGT